MSTEPSLPQASPERGVARMSRKAPSMSLATAGSNPSVATDGGRGDLCFRT